MKYFFGYHMAHKHGAFSAIQFFTNNRLSLDPDGNVIYVVSGHKIRSTSLLAYRLEGKFSIERIDRNRSSRFSEKKWHLFLKPIVVLLAPRDLQEHAGFNKQRFHYNYTSGQGLREIEGENLEVVKLFEELLIR